jgi:hypothetical protein
MKIYLCGRPNACCPELEYNPTTDMVSITDDDGDIVCMTKEQFEVLKKVEL